MKMLGQNIAIKKMEPEKATASGIILSGTKREAPLFAEVVACNEKAAVKVGDTVLFAKYAGISYKHEGEDLTIIHENDILGIVTDPEVGREV